jgi:hypothetical protein
MENLPSGKCSTFPFQEKLKVLYRMGNHRKEELF